MTSPRSSVVIHYPFPSAPASGAGFEDDVDDGREGTHADHSGSASSMVRIFDLSQLPPHIHQALRPDGSDAGGSGGGGGGHGRASLQCTNTMDEGCWQLHTIATAEDTHTRESNAASDDVQVEAVVNTHVR